MVQATSDDGRVFFAVSTALYSTPLPPLLLCVTTNRIARLEARRCTSHSLATVIWVSTVLSSTPFSFRRVFYLPPPTHSKSAWTSPSTVARPTRRWSRAPPPRKRCHATGDTQRDRSPFGCLYSAVKRLYLVFGASRQRAICLLSLSTEAILASADDLPKVEKLVLLGSLQAGNVSLL